MKILLIILGILAAIVILLVILLHFSVKAYIDADKKRLCVIIKYFGFKLYELKLPEENPETSSEPPDNEPEPEFEIEDIPVADTTKPPPEYSEDIEKKIAEYPAEPPADNNTEEQAEPPADKPEEEPDAETDDETKEPKPSLLDMWNEYKKYIPAGKKAFRKLLKLIRFRDLKLILTVGNDDPYKAGLNFGRINAAVYSLLGLICSIFSVSIDHTEINCDYESKTFDISFSTVILIRPSAVIALAAYLGIYYLKIRKSMKKLENIAKAKENSE